MNFNEELQKDLEKLKSAGLYRELKSISSAPGRDIVFRGKTYINFSSNNYLGLAAHPAVKNAAIEAVEKYGAELHPGLLVERLISTRSLKKS